MNYLDVYYRALIDYRRNTTDFRECALQRNSTAKANAKNDDLTIIRKICTVDTDWVDAIEEGLVHVEKAIREERQFIRSNGEVIDIEKVKNVSKDSVEHLARHSNLITRYEEGEDVVPDRLYTVERLSDYAVYENRFLYMLLCYLRDFITVRYNKILELEHTYNGSMTMNKNIVMTKRNISFEVKLQEERKDDLYLKKQSESKDIIVRIGNQLKLVLAFLATPLMQEVGKVAMLKPPITKTNVLRMNHNFRGALALYEYISAYDKKGYTVEEKVQKQSPFRMDIADEMAEIVMISSFLTYEHGLNLKSELQVEYDKEEERRREAEKQRMLEQLKALRHRIRESGESPEEYMLMLEKVNRMLREDSEKLVVAKQEIENLKNEILGLERDKKALNAQIVKLQEEIEALKEAHAKELIRLDEEHRAAISALNDEHEAEKTRIIDEYEGQLQSEREEHKAELDALKAEMEEEAEAHRQLIETMETEHRDFVESLKAEHSETVAKITEDHKNELENKEAEHVLAVAGIRAMWQAEAHQLKGDCEEMNERISKLEAENQELSDAKTLSDARLVSMRSEHGFITEHDDFTNQEVFEEMEHQLAVFVKFFKKQWNITKKVIRQKAFREFFDGIKAEKEAKKNKNNKVENKAEENKIDDNNPDEVSDKVNEADTNENAVQENQESAQIVIQDQKPKNKKEKAPKEKKEKKEKEPKPEKKAKKSVSENVEAEPTVENDTEIEQMVDDTVGNNDTDTLESGVEVEMATQETESTLEESARAQLETEAQPTNDAPYGEELEAETDGDFDNDKADIDTKNQSEMTEDNEDK